MKPEQKGVRKMVFTALAGQMTGFWMLGTFFMVAAFGAAAMAAAFKGTRK